MPTLTYLGDEYSCATAIKGADYIHLLNEAGVMIAAFDEIKDFSGFKLTNGSYTSPAADHDCYLAVLRDDGTIGRGGHKCSDIPMTAADVGAFPACETVVDLRAVNKNIIVSTTAETLNTPYTAGLTTYANGLCVVGYVNNSNKTLLYFSRNHHELFIQRQVGGTWGTWFKFYHEGNKPTSADVGAVALNGSNTMTGDLLISRANAAVSAQNTSTNRKAKLQSVDDGSAYLHNTLDNSNRSSLQLKPETDDLKSALTLLRFVSNKETKAYIIHHTGNKPTGSYTGNGSATERTIDTGGVGNCVSIRGGTLGAIVTTNGGMAWDANSGEMWAFSYTDASFVNGVLKLATNSFHLNDSTVTYSYQVL